jgi:hypothetical protein
MTGRRVLIEKPISVIQLRFADGQSLNPEELLNVYGHSSSRVFLRQK